MNIKNFKVEDLKNLICKADDTFCNQIRIDKDGNIFMYSAKPGDYKPDTKNYKLRTDVMQAGNGYVGKEASEDSDYINDLYISIIEGWENGDDLVGVD